MLSICLNFHQKSGSVCFVINVMLMKKKTCIQTSVSKSDISRSRLESAYFTEKMNLSVWYFSNVLYEAN